jgi:hypothetical protein
MSQGGDGTASDRRAILELAAYFASAAALLPDEPLDYAQFRLLEGALRALRVLERIGPDDADVSTACAQLEAGLVPTKGNPTESKRLADDLTTMLASKLRKPDPSSGST